MLAQQSASAPLTRISRSAEGLVLETGGTSVQVVMRFWAMPLGRGWRWRFVCPKCGMFRDVLHWRGEWGCRGKDCHDLEHACRHELRWCPAPRPCRGSGWETKLLWQIKRIGLRPTNFLMKQFFCGDQMLAKRVNCFFKPISALKKRALLQSRRCKKPLRIKGHRD